MLVWLWVVTSEFIVFGMFMKLIPYYLGKIPVPDYQYYTTQFKFTIPPYSNSPYQVHQYRTALVQNLNTKYLYHTLPTVEK